MTKAVECDFKSTNGSTHSCGHDMHSETPSNIVLCDLGTSIAGCGKFRMVVKRTVCHGAMIELGVYPINIAANPY